MKFVVTPAGVLADGEGRVFDPWDWCWRGTDGGAPVEGETVSACAALEHLSHGPRRLLPVGVIGPREATARQCELAEELGAALARIGVPVLCGGKGGVMEAVARGVRVAGGLSIAFLPDDDWRGANAHVTLPLATGIGKARNVLIAQASAALVAVGGGYGTLTEIAFGLHFAKPVFALDAAPEVPGMVHLASVDETVEAVAAALLNDARLS